MRLIHAEIELEFAEEFSSYSISQKMHKALTGKMSAAEELVEPGVEFRSPKKKQLVNWDIGSCRIVMESFANFDECVGKMVAILQTINTVAPIGKLSRRELTTYWILPVENYNFKSLERKYRDSFITQQPTWKNVFDSSVIIDMKIDDLTLHHQSGAMKTSQLRQEFSEFKLESIPKVFLFLWAAIESDKLVEYSAEDMDRFLTTTLERSKYHSELFEETWRKIL